MTELGITQAVGKKVQNPLPISWLGLASAPTTPPSWAGINKLSAVQLKNLQAQIGYNLSNWDYNLIGTNNELGRYQFTADVLENYGFLIKGSTTAYGTAAVKYSFCWQPVTIRKNTNSYANYIYNITSLQLFLTNTASQEHLAYQYIYDLYNSLLQINAIVGTDAVDVVAGMIYVGWMLGVGTPPTPNASSGTGAYAWRYSGQGNGTDYFNSGRYAINVLSQ